MRPKPRAGMEGPLEPRRRVGRVGCDIFVVVEVCLGVEVLLSKSLSLELRY